MIRTMFLTLLTLAGATEAVPPTPATSLPTTFVVMGHLYPLLKQPSRLGTFLRSVNEQRPTFVFILGDSGLQEKQTVEIFRKHLESSVYFVPGNHELKGDRGKRYRAAIGYTDRVITTPDARFLLLNSSAPVEEIKRFLRSELKSQPSTPIILMVHHRIWDDTLLNPEPYQHDKSYYFSEIYPLLKNRVTHIFAGNSKRQYFRDLRTSRHYGKQNIYNVFWSDSVGAITCYSVGMGDAYPHATYVTVTVRGSALQVIPHSVAWYESDLATPKWIHPDTRSRPPSRR